MCHRNAIYPSTPLVEIRTFLLTRWVISVPIGGVRVLVLCPELDSVAKDSGSVVSILNDLGCRVLEAGFDLDDLDLKRLAARPPNIVVLDAGDEIQRAVSCQKKLCTIDILADIPTLVAVTVPRLSGMDFSVGWNDFILSPVVPAELYARLRQLDWRTATFDSEEVLKAGELVIDLAGYEARLGGRQLDFTHQEFELLRFLAQNRGRVYTREQLLERVWGYEYTGGTRTVDIHVRRIRAKLGSNNARLIETVRNVGYKMRSG